MTIKGRLKEDKTYDCMEDYEDDISVKIFAGLILIHQTERFQTSEFNENEHKILQNERDRMHI